jgi:hypothetical protein
LDKCQPSSAFIYFLVPPFFGGRPFVVPYVPFPAGIMVSPVLRASRHTLP